MNVPIRLYKRARDGAIVETLEPGESGTLLYGAGTALVESVAEASGVAAYLRQRKPPTKAVDQAEVEDKAVQQSEVEDKAVPGPREVNPIRAVVEHARETEAEEQPLPLDTRRTGGGRRG